ncbi:hypothetical protein OEZ86_000509 [Tetradesmus obliquus]|nr:hypothetical protein OEZ86_000509 [Tetradesmus obliquus]
MFRLRLQSIRTHAQRQPCCWGQQLQRAAHQRHGRSGRSSAAYSSSSGYTQGRDQQPDGQDMLGGLLDSCLSTCSSISGSVVNRAADMLQSIAPAGAPRSKVEVCVKGALLLLVLGLLKGVINFVLLVGTIGLAVYAATQVFGWNAVLLGQRGAFSDGGDWPPGTQQQQQQQHGAGGYQRAAAGQQGTAAAGQGWAYQQQQQQQQQGRPQAPWDALLGQQQQDDVVDVFYGGAAPKRQ